MNLSPEQVAAAKSIGCAFFPASEMQVQRLTMQRRVFRVDGKPYLVTRDGSYYETAGTLAALIAHVTVAPPSPPVAVPEPPQPAASSEAAPHSEAPHGEAPHGEASGTPPREIPPAAVPAAEGVAAATPVAEPATAAASSVEPEPPAVPVPRKRGRPRKVVASAADAAPAETPAEAQPQPAALPPESEPEPGPPAEGGTLTLASPPPAMTEEARGERQARVARRRAGGVAAPKWQTAGPARRGRLKPG